MMIYGKNAVLEALGQGQVERVLVARGLHPGALRELETAARQAGVPLEQVPRIVLDEAVRTTRHQGIVAELPEPNFSDPDAPLELAEKRGEQPLLVLLDHVQDPRNFGAIIRSTEVLGGHGVITEERRSAPLSAVAVKASAGATAHLPVVRVTNLPRYIDQLKQRGVWVYGADPAAEETPDRIDWDRPAALVIGSEGSGLRRLVREKCDALVRIPSRGRIGSLNAGVAAGILLYAVQHGRAQHAVKADDAS